MEDFYIDECGLASYVEAQWLDKFRELGLTEKLQSNSKWVPDSYIESDFFRCASELISSGCRSINLHPESMLEVGASLGRTCFELIEKNPSLAAATIVEPSARLLTHFQNIMIHGGEQQFPYIKGRGETGWLKLDVDRIANECSHIKFDCINEPFKISTVRGVYDLTLCLNVLDQCESPLSIVNGLMKNTRPGGIIVLSCSYQWSKKHLKNKSEGISDINAYFSKSWLKIEEAELNYRFRFNERFSLLFLSHLVIYKKL